MRFPSKVRWMQDLQILEAVLNPVPMISWIFTKNAPFFVNVALKVVYSIHENKVQRVFRKKIKNVRESQEKL